MRNLRSFIKKPTILSIITTYKCTSSCNNCCFQCTPSRSEFLAIDEIKKYIKEAIDTYDTIKLVVFTGGECFLYKEQLPLLVEFASKLGLKTRIVTNGYWANTYEIAYQKINNLVSVGLNEINFSTGDDHLEYVPFNVIKNAIIASIANGLAPLVNIESAEEKKFTSKNLLNDSELKKFIEQGKLHIINGIWIPMKNEKKQNISSVDRSVLLKGSNKFSLTEQRCTNLFTTITIDPNHRMTACCGLTSKYIKFLDLGSLKKYSIKFLYEKQFGDFLKIWISTEGPHKIMGFISKHFSNSKFEYEKMHPCQVCAMIFNNSEYLTFLRSQYKQVYTNIILKYLINK